MEPSVIVTCDNCKKEFKRFASVLKAKKNKRIYCSRQCQKAAGHTTLICESCSKSFLRHKSAVKKGGNHVFCSAACSKGKQGFSGKPYEWLYNRLHRAADSRNLKIAFSYEEFCNYTNILNCMYCNAPIEWSEHASTNSVLNVSTYNLDRKNNDLGYTLDNCIVCCRRCNMAKNNLFTYEEWVQIGNTIRSFSCQKD
jgi:hypothetical protein